MENQCKFKYIMLCKNDFMVHAKIPIETESFFQRMTQSGIELIFLEYTIDIIHTIKQKRQCNALNTLAICAWDYEIEVLKDTKIGVVAYQNPSFKKQFFEAVLMIVEGFEEVDFMFFLRLYQRKQHLPWKILETKRTYVREMTIEDLSDLFALYQKEGMTKYVEPLKVWEEEVLYTKSYIKYQYGYYGYGMWLVFLKDTHQLIGRAGLDHRECQGETLLELGYMIDPLFQRQGFALEVCHAILTYAKQNLDFEKIHCFIQKENMPSRLLAEKLEFKNVNYMHKEEMDMLLYEKTL